MLSDRLQPCKADAKQSQKQQEQKGGSMQTSRLFCCSSQLYRRAESKGSLPPARHVGLSDGKASK